MGWFGSKAIDSTANLIDKTGSAFDKLFTSDEERDAADILKRKIAQQPAQWAHELNLLNARDSNWFNSGWRPGLGWVCVLSAFFYFVPQFVLGAYLWVSASLSSGVIQSYPVAENGLWQLVALLLGGGAIRSIDKMNGVAK